MKVKVNGGKISSERKRKRLSGNDGEALRRGALDQQDLGHYTTIPRVLSCPTFNI